MSVLNQPQWHSGAEASMMPYALLLVQHYLAAGQKCSIFDTLFIKRSLVNMLSQLGVCFQDGSVCVY